jgi:large subunit ribosomal protein L15
MVKKPKSKKYRGSGSHGRGQKAGRGKGKRGGSGNAGLHKHRYATTVIGQKNGVYHFGRHGFVRRGTNPDVVVINVRDLMTRFEGQKAVDLAEHGYTKLLGGGAVSKPFEVTVASATASAVSKIEAAGGKVVQTAPADGDA